MVDARGDGVPLAAEDDAPLGGRDTVAIALPAAPHDHRRFRVRFQHVVAAAHRRCMVRIGGGISLARQHARKGPPLYLQQPAAHHAI